MRKEYQAAWEINRLKTKMEMLGSEISYPRAHDSNCERRDGDDYCNCHEWWDEQIDEEMIELQRLQTRYEELQKIVNDSTHLDLIITCAGQLSERNKFHDPWGKPNISTWQYHHHQNYFLVKRDRLNKTPK